MMMAARAHWFEDDEKTGLSRRRRHEEAGR